MNASTNSELQRLQELFENLPDEADRDYELRLTKLVEGATNPTLDALEMVLQDPTYSEASRFAAFFALSITFRRFKSVTKWSDLIDNYGTSVRSHLLYPHLMALYYKARNDFGDIELAVTLSQQASKNLPSHPGVLHSFAESVAAALDAGIELAPDVVAGATEALRVAIALEPYPKFYCTRGRLLASQGDYEHAQDSIRHAIDLEDERKVDYAIRLGDYQYYLSGIYLNQVAQSLQSQSDGVTSDLISTKNEVSHELDNMRTQYLTMLGFFTAIISFTLGSIQLLQNQELESAAILIGLLALALVFAYACFDLITRPQRSRTAVPAVAVSTGSLLIIIIALLAYWK